MESDNKAQLGTLLGICAVVLCSIVMPKYMSEEDSVSKSRLPFPTFNVGNVAEASGPASISDEASLRVAQRMSRRIARNQGTSPPISTLMQALREQRELLRHHTTVTLQLPDNLSYRTWEVNLQRYPTWLKAEISPASARFRVDEERIHQYLQQETIEGLVPPKGAVITELVQDGDRQRAVTASGSARPGIVFDLPSVTHDLALALTSGTEAVTASLQLTEGPLHNASGVPLGELKLLGMGKSDFKGSPAARIHNVRKAIGEHVHNTVVPPDATFSFNETLDGAVTLGNGWRDAKVIFNATELRMAPGGGICQASTTTFRAMLNAGFRPVKRANHSMYVTYYEKFGVGIDATVFPGKQDLTFVNDTGNYLLFQAYTDGTEAVVQIYGTPDGRKTEVSGPYFSSSDLTDFPSEERQPRSNEIAWVQHINFPDGREEKEVIVSRYTSLPRSLAKKYETTVHASAGLEAM